MSSSAITVEGFVSHDLTVRNAGTHRVVDVTVPVTPSRKVDGEWVEDRDKTVWYEATFWDEHADAVLDTVQKGSLVILSGVPELEVFKRANGEPGAKIKIGTFPTLSAVVRRPKRGQAAPQRQDEPWADSAPAQPAVDGDVWSTPGAFDDSTPF
jgi:single-stranded DNA-binding protein